MSRSVNLLICLAILVCGAAIEAPAENKTSSGADKPCCGKPGNQGEEKLSICLQTLVFQEDSHYLWLADMYYDSTCTDVPVQDYVWTDTEESVPQTCFSETGCLEPPMGGGICPVISKPLPKNQGYVDVLNALVRYPGLPADKTWNPKDALVDLGELRTTYVKVKNVEGKYFAVRLATGIAEMNKIRFPAGAFPRRPKIADHKILIGFEAEMAPEDIEKLPEAIPTPWKRYADCPTAFVLTVANSSYCVTSTASNPVQTTEKIANLLGTKPIPKRIVK